MRVMLAEFIIAKDLKHPNIVDYKYVMKHVKRNQNKYECHIIMEFIDGIDMEKYISYLGKALPILRV